MDGARPAGEVATRERGVRAEREDADASVCVLLLPGAMRKNEAGTGEVAATGADRAGALGDGEICAMQDRVDETWRTGAEAHLTGASAASEASPLHAGLGNGRWRVIRGVRWRRVTRTGHFMESMECNGA